MTNVDLIKRVRQYSLFFLNCLEEFTTSGGVSRGFGGLGQCRHRGGAWVGLNGLGRCALLRAARSSCENLGRLFPEELVSAMDNFKMLPGK